MTIEKYRRFYYIFGDDKKRNAVNVDLVKMLQTFHLLSNATMNFAGGIWNK